MGVNDIVIAADGGGTKTDILALTRAGEVIRRVRIGSTSPHRVGLQEALAALDREIVPITRAGRIARVALYLAGLDFPSEIEQLRTEASRYPWGRGKLLAENDVMAALRAGTASPNAVAVICGTGTNAVGVRAGRERVTFPALGRISGDWGGGAGLGEAALWHAARDADGRGQRTALTRAVEEHFQVPLAELIWEIHSGQRLEEDLAELAPSIFQAAAAGDAVAGSLVARQGEEVVAYVRAVATRLGLGEEGEKDFPVVLAGGILQGGHADFLQQIRSGLSRTVPGAQAAVLQVPPLAGAALLALESVGVSGGADPVEFWHRVTGSAAPGPTRGNAQ